MLGHGKQFLLFAVRPFAVYGESERAATYMEMFTKEKLVKVKVVWSYLS